MISSRDRILQLANMRKNQRVHEMCVSKMCSNMLGFLWQGTHASWLLRSLACWLGTNLQNNLENAQNTTIQKKSALCHFFFFKFLTNGSCIPWPLDTHQ
jgi:hypothetical protein